MRDERKKRDVSQEERERKTRERERRERAREERKSGEDERVLRGSALTSVLFLFLFFLVNLSIETMTSLAAFTNKARCVRVGARANQRQVSPKEFKSSRSVECSFCVCLGPMATLAGFFIFR